MLMMTATAPQMRERDWKAACLAIGTFLVTNTLRLILLHDTGDWSIQVDYIIIPIAYWGSRRIGLTWPAQVVIGMLAAVTVVCGDLLDIMSRRFNWSHGVVIDYAYSMPDLPWRTILPFVILGFATAILCLLPFAVYRKAFPIWPLSILVMGLLLGNALLYGGTRGDVNTSRLTRSFVSHAISGAYNRLVVGRTLMPFVGNSMAKDIPASASPPRQILSVAMESFGLERNPAKRDLLLAPLRQALGSSYTFRASSHGFDGSTLPGEIRELCALQADGIPNTPRLLARLTSSCLPARLRRLGYDTQALHGNGPLMYDRRAVYPAMGFARAWFDTDLRRAAPDIRPCPGTAFGGVCDADLYARALSLFDGRRRFVHVLTLDAHLPIPAAGTSDCQPAFAGDAGLCRYAAATEASLDALARAVLAARNPPELIVLYGDHAPPFAGVQARAEFATHQVPYVVLTRTGSARP